MNRIYGSCTGLLACLLLCTCAGQEPLAPDGLIRLGTRAGGYEGSATRASVNDLAGLAAVGDKVGVYGVVTTRTDALYAPLTSEWNGTPLMDNVRTTGIDAATGMLFWNGDYTYPQEENRRVKFCVYHPYAPVGTGGDNYVEAVAGQSPVLHFRLTGTEDVMWVRPVTGSRREAPSALLFEHKLTQLRFRLVDDEGEFAGVTVTGLAFNGGKHRLYAEFGDGRTGRMVCRAGCRTVSFEIACRHKRYNGNAAGIGGRSDAATGTARVPAYADNRQQGRLPRYRDTAVGRRNGLCSRTLLYGDTEIPRPYGGCPFGKGHAVGDGRIR